MQLSAEDLINAIEEVYGPLRSLWINQYRNELSEDDFHECCEEACEQCIIEISRKKKYENIKGYFFTLVKSKMAQKASQPKKEIPWIGLENLDDKGDNGTTQEWGEIEVLKGINEVCVNLETRQIMKMVILDRMTLQEVAESLDKKYNTVRKTFRKYKMKLRIYLKRNYF